MHHHDVCCFCLFTRNCKNKYYLNLFGQFMDRHIFGYFWVVQHPEQWQGNSHSVSTWIVKSSVQCTMYFLSQILTNMLAQYSTGVISFANKVTCKTCSKIFYLNIITIWLHKSMLNQYDLGSFNDRLDNLEHNYSFRFLADHVWSLAAIAWLTISIQPLHNTSIGIIISIFRAITGRKKSMPWPAKGLCKEKNSENPSLLWRWVGGSRSHSEFFIFKSSQNSYKPVLQIFASSIPCVFCLYIAKSYW